MKFIKRYNESFNGKNFFDIQRKLVDDFKSIDDFKEKLKNEYLKFEELIKDNLIDLTDLLQPLNLWHSDEYLIFDKYIKPYDVHINNKNLSVQLISSIEVYVKNVDFKEIEQIKILNQLKKFNAHFSGYSIKYSIIGLNGSSPISSISNKEFIDIDITKLSKLLLENVLDTKNLVLIEIKS
jgi:hypothetical protein